MAVFDFFFRSQNDIKIEAFPSFETLQNALIRDFVVHTIELKITNNTEYALFIELPIIKLYKKVNGFTEHKIPAPVGLYPFHLKHSCSHRIKFNLPNDIFDKLKPKDKIRFIITDVLKIKYLSRKYTISELAYDL